MTFRVLRHDIEKNKDFDKERHVNYYVDYENGFQFGGEFCFLWNDGAAIDPDILHKLTDLARDTYKAKKEKEEAKA